VTEDVTPAAEMEILPPGSPDAPTPADRAYAYKLGMSDAEIDAEYEKLVLQRLEKPGYPAWRWFDRYAAYRKRHPVKRTWKDVADDMGAALDARIAAAGGAAVFDAPVKDRWVFVVRGTDEWRRQVRGGHRDSLYEVRNADEGWWFQMAEAA
jgi:hypothetical protein